MTPKFAGFSKQALQFLEALEKNNEREWFLARKGAFEQHLKSPMTQLVEAINLELARLAPQYVTEPKKAMFRIYRDTRFSSNKSPYKTHMAASFHHRGLVDSSGAGLYVSVCHRQLEVGGGIYHPPADTLLAVRTHIAEHYELLEKMLEDRKRKKLMGELRGDELSRTPKGFPANHRAARLLKKKDWYLFAELPAEVAVGPKLWKELIPRFEILIPVLDYFNSPLLQHKSRTAKTFLP